jgi:Cu-processing system ATP-binding protein
MFAILAEDVTKQFANHRALDGIDFALESGRCLALIGHNGAGKTTLMKLILGLIAPSAGCVRVLDADPVRAGTAFRRQIGFLPENVVFHDEFSGRDTLRFYARLKGVPAKECDPLLERVGLSVAAARRVKTYSKGMRQRLGLAQALLGQPRLLLLDEPTTGLDPALRQEFFQIVRDLRDAGTTVILSSHILTELEARTDLAAIIREGRLVAFGELERLRTEAGLPVTVRVRGDITAIVQRLGRVAVVAVDRNREWIEFACPLAEKMALLRRLAELGPLCIDIDLRLPSLDDVYLHYSGKPMLANAALEAAT